MTGSARKRVLVANRGEIALRVVRTCRVLGIHSIAAHSEADAGMAFVREADEAVCIGPAPARESYLDIPRVVEAARNLRADAVHPGYGFLSENAEFAESLEQAGIAFIGPRPETIRLLGNKVSARGEAEKAGLPVTRGTTRLADARRGEEEAARIGYPVLLKAAAGGGGRGMRVVEAPGEMAAAFRAAAAEALASFGRSDLFLEKFVRPARHIEVQVFGDGQGGVAALGERECSVQRRHQKVLEEAPSPAVDPALRERLCGAAAALARAAKYRGAGTVEFLLAPDGSFHFLEVNCRLQVEHPVTEMVMGVDLVAAQLHLALTGAMPVLPTGGPRGWAVEARVCAEDPEAGFVPSTGRILALEAPEGGSVRWDCGFAAGDTVTPHYDSLLGKLIAWGATREEAVARCAAALESVAILGPRTNAAYLHAVLSHPRFREGRLSTSFLDEEFAGWKEPEGCEAPTAVLAAAAHLLLEGGGSGAGTGRGNAAGIGGAGGSGTGGRDGASGAPSPWESLSGWRAAGGGGA